MRKSQATPFSLSFLDIMFCGFGAVVLLVMILNGEVLKKREAKFENLRGELKRATSLEEYARAHLEEIRKKVEAIELREGDIENQAIELESRIVKTEEKTHSTEKKALELRASVDVIKREKAALERTTRLLQKKKTKQRQPGKNLAGFTGDGRRQYLTGLKLGGERTLILLDASASMLDEKIVDIVRRKLMNANIRRRSPKWQRAVRTLHWLIANLKPGKRFQVYYFNTASRPVIPGTEKKWLDSGNANHIDETLAGVRRLAPENGTSLHRAFTAIRKFTPKPDSVILITDGLPTQGDKATGANIISGEERLRLFEEAISRIPRIPVNTLLFPIEGDPDAAAAFWNLAISSRGSFITPSRDWP